MNTKKAYSGIDYLRIAAALLVIAIHTIPLTDSAFGFIYTRVIARLAVPFFITASGFFLITRYSFCPDKLKRFTLKTAKIYPVAIILYIPLNIYNGYFTEKNLLQNIVKDIIFDGTAYHLWYLPASILGAFIAWLLVRRLGYKGAFIITGTLYVLGLFGDSYYGAVKAIPLLREIYNLFFAFSDYTRNGVFFTPIFFVLGGFLADMQKHISLKASLLGLGASLFLMAAEAALIKIFNLSRHDSMYIFLLPSLYFMFIALSYWRGKHRAYLSQAALIIYIIHPLIIVFVRMFAKIIGAQAILVDNAIVHYLTVCALSCAAAAAVCFIIYKTKKVDISPRYTPRAWLEIDLNRLESNVKALKRAMPSGCELMAVVKANAYGHNAPIISAHLNRIGVNAFASATIDEAIALRRHGISGEILILGQTPPERARELWRYRLTQSLTDYDYALRLNERGFKIKAHIKIDTGMHRLGFSCTDIDAATTAFLLKNINIGGIYTHLSAANSLTAEAEAFTISQLIKFYELVTRLKQQGIRIPKVHIQSSYGLLNYPKLKCNYVRAGIAMYGAIDKCNNTRLQLNLRPVLSLKASIILIKDISVGESAGYGNAFIAKRNSKIAIISIGYADGYARSLADNNGTVLINGQHAKVISVCMDMLLADITDIESAQAGDEVTLIGKSGGEEITAAEVAKHCQSIPNEFLSRLGQRLLVASR